MRLNTVLWSDETPEFRKEQISYPIYALRRMEKERIAKINAFLFGFLAGLILTLIVCLGGAL